MVCYGNICRSPMAAAVLHNKVAKIETPKILVDSAGTSHWHVGQGPNPPSKRTWERAGYKYEHVASQFNYSRLGNSKDSRACLNRLIGHPRTFLSEKKYAFLR
ncbi:MAG: hypothetical protein EBW79_04345 [Actinobacteria bacterium]|nr:hypothetical protein [Actinomycetota bacterium]